MTLGASGEVAAEELDAVLRRYPWFRTARRLRTGDGGLGAAECGVLCTELERVDAERLRAVSADDLIDRFLRAGDYRIVAEAGDATEEVTTEASLSEEEDVVSEELAEIYRQQGLLAEAKAIYRRLSLLNPEKSVYFAELIEQCDTSENNK